MQTVYLEPTVVSYCTARPSRDLLVAGHQQVTLEWWENVLPRLSPYISQFVLEEVGRGDSDAAERRLQAVQGFPVLEMSPAIGKLALEYYEAIGIPQRSRTDAFHIALATFHGMDYLVTWNCVHIAGARVRGIVQGVNAQHELATPIICTPEELMEV